MIIKIIIIVILININVTIILEKSSVGESSKQGIQVAWSTPIHHIKWWIIRFRGIHRALVASDGGLFLILIKGFQSLFNITRSSVLAVVGALYLSLRFIVIIIIVIIIVIVVIIVVIIINITFIINIIFVILIIIRIFIESSLLFLWGKLTVWFCFFLFLHLS